MIHIENIPHILQYGITHKNSSHANPNFKTIGDTSLIDFRATKSVEVNGETITLGDFIPFYFGIRMPMLYVIQHGGNYVPKPVKPENIIYIAISLQSVINKPDMVYFFTDGHATDSLTTFYDKTSVEKLPSCIDWVAVKAKYWSGDDIETDLKRRKQAEFLIKGDIPIDFIVGYVCYNIHSMNRLIEMGIDENIIKIYPNAYY